MINQNNNCLNRVFLVLGTAFFGFLAVGNVQSKSEQVSVRPVIKCFESDNALVKDALTFMKKAWRGVDHDKQPYVVCCTYKIVGKTPVEAVAKIHYGGYHQNPTSISKVFVDNSAKIKVDRVVEFVYKTTEKGSMALIERDPNGNTKKGEQREIAFSKDLFA